MLSTLIFDELSVQTMLQTKQFANQRFTPTGLLILRGDLLSFFRMCEVETKLFHTWQETGQQSQPAPFNPFSQKARTISSSAGDYITWQELAFYDNSSKLPFERSISFNCLSRSSLYRDTQQIQLGGNAYVESLIPTPQLLEP